MELKTKKYAITTTTVVLQSKVYSNSTRVLKTRWLVQLTAYIRENNPTWSLKTTHITEVIDKATQDVTIK